MVDIDECTDGSDDCDAQATCADTVGSFTCTCNAGYTGDGRTSGTGCTSKYRENDEVVIPIEVDACVLSHVKPVLRDCIFHRCNVLNILVEIVDIDECTDGSDDCDAQATCADTVGSFTCTCNAGYTGDGRTSGTGCTSKCRENDQVVISMGQVWSS